MLGLILREWVIPLVAIFAAIFAGLSAIIAKRALQITRKTQRPFLNIKSFHAGFYPFQNNQTTIQEVVLIIHNSGNYPADGFSIGCSVKNKTGQLHLLSLRAQQATVSSLVFPSEEMQVEFEENPSNLPALTISQNDELKLEIVISYKNKLTKENYQTIRVWKNAPNTFGISYFLPCPNNDEWK